MTSHREIQFRSPLQFGVEQISHDECYTISNLLGLGHSPIQQIVSDLADFVFDHNALRCVASCQKKAPGNPGALKSNFQEGDWVRPSVGERTTLGPSKLSPDGNTLNLSARLGGCEILPSSPITLFCLQPARRTHGRLSRSQARPSRAATTSQGPV